LKGKVAFLYQTIIYKRPSGIRGPINLQAKVFGKVNKVLQLIKIQKKGLSYTGKLAREKPVH